MTKSLFLEERIAIARRLMNEHVFSFASAMRTVDEGRRFLALVRQTIDVLDGDPLAVPEEWQETKCGGKSSCCMDASESSSK